MTDSLHTIWKKIPWANADAFQDLSGGAEKKPQMTSVTTAVVAAEIRTVNLPNTNLERYLSTILFRVLAFFHLTIPFVVTLALLITGN
jgi:hypothetical protein